LKNPTPEKGKNMTAPDIIKQLVERFDWHRKTHRAGKYNETQLRNEFLNPFLEALGWEVLKKNNTKPVTTKWSR